MINIKFIPFYKSPNSGLKRSKYHPQKNPKKHKHTHTHTHTHTKPIKKRRLYIQMIEMVRNLLIINYQLLCAFRSLKRYTCYPASMWV